MKYKHWIPFSIVVFSVFLACSHVGLFLLPFLLFLVLISSYVGLQVLVWALMTCSDESYESLFNLIDSYRSGKW